MNVRTESYEFAHGRKPRGFGAWAFKINGQLKFFDGLYGEALMKAKAFAREELRDPHAVITVQS